MKASRDLLKVIMSLDSLITGGTFSFYHARSQTLKRISDKGSVNRLTVC